MHQLTWIGIAFLLLGLTFVAIPVLRNYVSLDELPSWLIYIYENDNFYFGTSPILIAISALILLMRLVPI